MINWSAMPGRATRRARSGRRSGHRSTGGAGPSLGTVVTVGVLAGGVALAVALGQAGQESTADADAAAPAAPTTVTVAAGDGAYGCLLNDGYSDAGGRVEASVRDADYCRSLTGEPAPGPAESVTPLVCGENLACPDVRVGATSQPKTTTRHSVSQGKSGTTVTDSTTVRNPDGSSSTTTVRRGKTGTTVSRSTTTGGK